MSIWLRSGAAAPTRWLTEDVSGRQLWARLAATGNFQYSVAVQSFRRQWRQQDRQIITLAIETSCDDTAVALLSVTHDAESSGKFAKVLFHEKITSKSEAYHGIHPLVALHSHQTQLALLVRKATQVLKSRDSQHKSSGTAAVAEAGRPDLVTVTRGPGMRSNLAVGLDTAKGLAIAWDIPLIGVHHMQAHALTPRLCSALRSEELQTHASGAFDDQEQLYKASFGQAIKSEYPFLSVLVSGGHTLLLYSRTLTEHEVLAETADIAIGDYLDKAARAILPGSALTVPYGKALEDFVNDSDHESDDSLESYQPPRSRQEELCRRTTSWGWSLGPPLSESKSEEKSSRRMMFSFSGLLSSVQKLASRTMLVREQRTLAWEAQRVAFEHVGTRILLYLESLPHDKRLNLTTIVVSGGVASSQFLRHVLRSMLRVRGFDRIQLLFPPSELCTDNALMIGWAGWEMYNAGYESDLSIQPLRKWSLDSRAEDGGVVGASGWMVRTERMVSGPNLKVKNYMPTLGM